jgi:hypothetical protein
MHWEFEPGEQVELELELVNPTAQSIIFSDSCSHAPWLVYTLFSEAEKDVTRQGTIQLASACPGSRGKVVVSCGNHRPWGAWPIPDHVFIRGTIPDRRH